MAQYLSTCMPWEIVVCVEYKDLNGILQQRQSATKRDIVYQFRFERPIANLHALRAANTNPANFVLRNYWHLWKGFPKIWYPFERLRLSAAKKLSSIWTALVIRSKKEFHPLELLSIREKLSSVRVRMTQAVRWKNVISVRTARAIRSKQLSSALLFQTTFNRAVNCDKRVKKCKLI